MLTDTLTIRVLRCRGCGKARTGTGARGWPSESNVCPTCSTTARRVADATDAVLSPEPTND